MMSVRLSNSVTPLDDSTKHLSMAGCATLCLCNAHSLLAVLQSLSVWQHSCSLSIPDASAHAMHFSLSPDPKLASAKLAYPWGVTSLCLQCSLQGVSVVAGEEEDLDLGKMVRESEVAWLHKADMPASGSGSGHAEHAGQAHQQGWHAQRQAPHSPDQGPAAARKRKQPPASRSASAHPGGPPPAPAQPISGTACILCLCATAIQLGSALAWVGQAVSGHFQLVCACQLVQLALSYLCLPAKLWASWLSQLS